MPFPSHLLTDVCLVSRFLGRGTDAFGTPSFGPWEPLKCAYQEAAQKVRDSDGNERLSTSSIATKIRLSTEDRVILPDQPGTEPTAPTTVDDERAVSPIAIRNERSRTSGWRLHQTFF